MERSAVAPWHGIRFHPAIMTREEIIAKIFEIP